MEGLAMWPFRRRQEMAPIPDVELTAEELEECRTCMHSFTRSEEGAAYMRKEHIEPFTRSVAAFCLMGRAERFLIGSSSHPENKRKACEAAAKACAVFPISIYFYDFALILEGAGERLEARKAFAEFLRRYETEELGPVERLWMSQRDVNAAILHASDVLAR